jgi:hypothetical protein
MIGLVRAGAIFMLAAIFEVGGVILYLAGNT